MDATYFLKERTGFIRFYYDASAAGFADVKHRIENELPPYDNPPYSEDPEPAFLEEWLTADSALEILGLTCVSLLSDSLKLYFDTLQKRVIGFSFADKKTAFQNGFPAAHRDALGEILGTDWSDCPVDWAVIEQIVLARNRGQHGECLTSMRTTFDGKMLEKHPRPIFANFEEMSCLTTEEGSLASFLMPSIRITREALFVAIGEVERLAAWIEGCNDRMQAWRRRRHSESE